MSAPTNRWKLGAFVVASALVGLTAAAVLGARIVQISTVTYKSYFDEAVTGLEVGSPVSFRGVRIGSVSGIDIAPDRRHVEITYGLGVDVLKRLGLGGTSRGKQTRILVPPDLRVQLASTGLTGTKYLQVDFFDTGGRPPPVLPFPVPDNTIPAIPSTMKNLEAAVVRAVDQLPDIAREVHGVVVRVNAMIDEVNRRRLAGKAITALDNANQVLATLQAKLEQLPVAELSSDAAATLQGASVALATLNRMLDRFDGEDGLLASVQRTSDSWNDVAGSRLGANLDETGRDLREAAVAVRQLVDALQRDPDMLIKGKARARP